jgi:archaellum component FlaF (FlaF/FlaG flagellin family)
MGFSTVAATAIIGVSLLIGVELIVSTTIPSIEDMHDSYDKMRDRSIEQMQTDITITNAAYVLPDTLISVVNTGSESINTTNCNILINGTSKSFTCNVNFIHPEQTAIFSIAERTYPGDIIKIITPNGVSEYHTF